MKLWHHDKTRRCLTCVEHGAPFDGGCDHCGYADKRWVKKEKGLEHLWETTTEGLSPDRGVEG